MQKLIKRHGNKINFLALLTLVLSCYPAMYLCLIIWQNSATIIEWCMILGRGFIGM